MCIKCICSVPKSRTHAHWFDKNMFKNVWGLRARLQILWFPRSLFWVIHSFPWGALSISWMDIRAVVSIRGIHSLLSSLLLWNRALCLPSYSSCHSTGRWVISASDGPGPQGWRLASSTGTNSTLLLGWCRGQGGKRGGKAPLRVLSLLPVLLCFVNGILCIFNIHCANILNPVGRYGHKTYFFLTWILKPKVEKSGSILDC